MIVFYLKIFMAAIRWFRVAIAALILLIAIATGIYFYVQWQPTPIIFEGCAVVFDPSGSSEVVPFGDPRCSK